MKSLAAIGASGLVAAVESAENNTDGTPLQFMPRTAPDPNPLQNELEKHPKCPYCGMSRHKFNHSRHLIVYDDQLVDGVCSIHCAAVSLSLNIDRGPKAIYAADFGSGAEIKPLVDVDQGVQYLVGSRLKGTMSRRSKMAFADADKATAAQLDKGGEAVGFEEALTAAYLDMAKDTRMIRQRRAERRARTQSRPQHRN